MCSIESIYISKKKLAKYEDIALLKSPNNTCFQNTTKVLLRFGLFLYVCNSNTVIKKMVYPCCGNCSKVYSGISSRNKHKWKKGHWSENNTGSDISFNEATKLFHCPTAGCATTAKHKYNIVKHHVTLSTGIEEK